ncbi:hypothetical protein [Amycolatopsis sp. WQ 127309]|uniref:hypothetical protein n=1 Tax=Amycolatopsis sp. WQ 127309 TaxID=2932773 RepID=UPI001FF35563|nr:hypothetical protein [Amycolatopsis sp. WQ 127309]UOZ04881.1 hypothetical protein MUY22_39590 [Amycolatopsis sp. WQ 127309]
MDAPRAGQHSHAGHWKPDGGDRKVRQWSQLLLGVLGVVLLVCAGLTWWSAEQALGTAPATQSSTKGALSSCGYRPGLTSCDPPELSTATIVVIIALAVIGAALATVALVDLLLRRRA